MIRRSGRPAGRSLLRASLEPQKQYSLRSSTSSSTSPGSPLLPQPSDIWVLPFQQKPELALRRMEIFSSATARSFQGILSQLSKSAFGFSIVPNPIEMTRWKALYIPAWIWDARIKGTAKRDASPNGDAAREDGVAPGAMITINFGSGPLISRQDMSASVSGEGMPKEVTGTIELTDNFFPGTSISPLSCINVSIRHQIDRTLDSPVQRYDPSHVPSVFTSADLDEMGSETIPAIPFDTSPLAIPDVLRRQSTIQSLPFTVSTEGLEWQKLEATPIYLPFYIANFKHEDREFTLALAATDESIGHCDMHFPPPVALNGPVKWPAKPLGSALFPGRSHFAVVSQSPFLADIDPDQWRSEADRRLAEEDLAETEGLTEEAQEAASKKQAEALLRSASTLVLCSNIRTDADRWLDSDGVRAQLSQTSITARAEQDVGGARIGRIVPFVKRDEVEDELDDDE